MYPTLRYLSGFLFVFFACFLSYSCGRHRPLSKEALLRYVNKDSRLTQTREFGDITVKAMFYPSQLMVYQELGEGNKSIEKTRLDSLERKYGSQYYFRLSFSKNHQQIIRQLGSFSNYSDMLQVFSFDMGRHINMTTEKNDTVYIKDYAFDQDFGIADANTIMAAFSKEKLHDTQEIYLNIGEFGLGIGATTFVFNREDLEELPRLNYGAM
jgi:hypothetical protein